MNFLQLFGNKISILSTYMQNKFFGYKQKKKMIIFYSRFIRKGDLCFDVGANIGERTKIFLALGAQVVVIEPQERCMNVLKKRFKNSSNIFYVQHALGENEDELDLMISSSSTISSMSSEWIKKVKSSGRFSDYSWDKSVKVKVTTLDNLIELYGKPSFCKIDVEGFEYPVLKGLSKPIPSLSFEFTPEYGESSIDCINYLDNLGYEYFNYSIGESMEMELPEWVSSTVIIEIFQNLSDKTIFGDIYAKSDFNLKG